MSRWTPILSDVLRWRDSCNVYAVVGDDGSLIIDAGTASWLARIDELPKPPVALVCTHYFRDHSAGATAAAEAGIPVLVPAGERALFADPEQHYRKRETYIAYDNIWDLFAPVEPVPLAGVLQDYETVSLAGFDIRVLPLPGATPTQIGLLLRTRRSKHLVVFSGETIHSPGRVPRLAPLQYNYAGLGGTAHVAFSAQLLRRHAVDLLLPSLGEPINDPDRALIQLHDNLIAHAWDRGYEREVLTRVGDDTVRQVTERLWMSSQALASSYFIVGTSGRALVLDYGYWYPSGSGPQEGDISGEPLWPAYSYPERRRPLLHSIDALQELAGVDQLTAVIPTHYHDDHVCGIPLLRRIHDTECWAPANFARLLENPQANRFPCTWPQPISVDRSLDLNEVLEWDGVRFKFAPMSGHTRFSALVGWELDGVRYVHAGDQYFPFDDRRPPREWQRPAFWAAYVYRNGAFADSYQQSAEWITRFRPDIVLSGHRDPVQTDDRFFELLAEYGREYAVSHRRVMPLGREEVHFGLDALMGWMWPYRVHVTNPRQITFEVTVRNPLPKSATLQLLLRGPHGWKGSAATVRAAAHAEVCVAMTITPRGPCRRQAVTVELHADRQPFGQILEALVSVGTRLF
jgi:glyoxylase-like metal-dependent hydrolase (beta-lactamase superfamily II)